MRTAKAVLMMAAISAAIFGGASLAAPSLAIDAVAAKALAGDYQAQRNLAYGYSTAPYPGQQANALLGCAWRIVIVHSGSAKVDDTDISNQRVQCGKLDSQQLAAAQAQARKLYLQVYGSAARF
jgi:hypothetical protein